MSIRWVMIRVIVHQGDLVDKLANYILILLESCVNKRKLVHSFPVTDQLIIFYWFISTQLCLFIYFFNNFFSHTTSVGEKIFKCLFVCVAQARYTYHVFLPNYFHVSGYC